jgi:hypothetical protein
MIGAADGDVAAVFLDAFLWLPAAVVGLVLDAAPWWPLFLDVVAAVMGAVVVPALGEVAAWFAITIVIVAPCVVLHCVGEVVVMTGTMVAVTGAIVVIGFAMLATAAVMVLFVVMLMPRLMKSLMVLQMANSVSEGMEMVVNATACLWSTVTAFACGPVPIRQTMEILGQDLILPNLAQLWVLWTELFGPTRRTAVSTSLTSALSCLAMVVDRASAVVKAVMFLFVSLFPARLAKC